MALIKRDYKDGETVITAENLNAIQEEIITNTNNFGGTKFSVKDDGAYVTYTLAGEEVTKKLGSSEGTATADQVVSGATFSSAVVGTNIEGTMKNNGSVSATFNPLTQTSVSIASGYTSGGSITLTSDLESALSEI